MEDFPYPHFFDKPEQVFNISRHGILFKFHPYIPRSVADELDNCHFREYDIHRYGLCSIYNLSRLYTHLFGEFKYEEKLTFYNGSSHDAAIGKYMDWLLETSGDDYRYHKHRTTNNISTTYDVIYMMQEHILFMNKRFKTYRVPPDKIPPDYECKSSGGYCDPYFDPLAELASSSRYYFKLNGREYQVLSDGYIRPYEHRKTQPVIIRNRINSMYLESHRTDSGMTGKIYISNIDGEWFYDTDRNSIRSNTPAHSINDFPDGTVFVSSFTRRELLNVLDAMDYASLYDSYNQLRLGWSALKSVIKDKSLLDNTIGKYVSDRDMWYTNNIYLKKVDGKLQFEYY